MLGKIEGKRRKGPQRMRWLDSIINSMGMNVRKPQETVKDRGAWRAAIHEVSESWTQLSNWTAATHTVKLLFTDSATAVIKSSVLLLKSHHLEFSMLFLFFFFFYLMSLIMWFIFSLVFIMSIILKLYNLLHWWFACDVSQKHFLNLFICNYQ